MGLITIACSRIGIVLARPWQRAIGRPSTFGSAEFQASTIIFEKCRMLDTFTIRVVTYAVLG